MGGRVLQLAATQDWDPMPLYEYECEQCHRHTEKRQKFSDPEITECPHCGGKLERVISAPAFSFAGGGWYKDGYASAKPAGATGASDKPSGAAESKPAGPAESKPAASAAAPAAPASSSSDAK